MIVNPPLWTFSFGCSARFRRKRCDSRFLVPLFGTLAQNHNGLYKSWPFPVLFPEGSPHTGTFFFRVTVLGVCPFFSPFIPRASRGSNFGVEQVFWYGHYSITGWHGLTNQPCTSKSDGRPSRAAPPFFSARPRFLSTRPGSAFQEYAHPGRHVTFAFHSFRNGFFL